MSSYKITKFRQNRKELIIECMGGKCQICGYSKCNAALELHHINSDEKELAISASCNHSWKKVSEELKKCILLCSNCHREVHKNISQIPKEYTKFEDVSIKKKDDLMFDQCPVCNGKKSIKNLTCSYTCSGYLARKVNWDNIDLIYEIETLKNSYCSIGRKMDCSDNAVRKRYFKLKNLNSPYDTN